MKSDFVFMQLFRKMAKDVKNHLQKAVDGGKEMNITFAVKAKTITSGLKYSLATGNWGEQGKAGTRAGVSQVKTAVSFPLLEQRRLRVEVGWKGAT
jgi:DNA-directed RNA polymerase II subunit RPB2